MDLRRILLFAIFSVSLVMLWDAWIKYQHNPLPQAPSVAQSAAAGVPLAAASGNAPVSGSVPISAAVERLKAPRVIVETDFLRAEVSELGGDIVRLELLKHGKTGDPSSAFVLFDDGKPHHYYAQSGLIGEGLPNHNTRFELPTGKVVLQAGQDKIELRLSAPVTEKGIKLTKILTFTRSSYQIDITTLVANSGTEALTTQAYFKLTRDENPVEQAGGIFAGASTYTGPAFYNEAEKYHKASFEDIAKGKAKLPAAGSDGWVAMIQHYFVAALLPVSGQREFFAQKLDEPGMYSVGLKQPLKTVAPGQSEQLTVALYAGPQEQKLLATLSPGLDLVVDYGLLTIIAAPLFWVLAWCHTLVGNWGWAIILLTVLIKLAFFPLSAASYRSMAKMKDLMPRMKRIQEQFKDDRMKMNQEMMELYKREKVNPMGGCWPMLVQMPVFIALYWVLLGAVEMRQAPWLAWIVDLSVKDPYFILPIVMGASSFVQMKLSPPPPDPTQAKVMMMMPLFFSVMMAWFPAGLVLYWTVNNLLSIAQQWYITRMMKSGDSAAKA